MSNFTKAELANHLNAEETSRGTIVSIGKHWFYLKNFLKWVVV